MSRALVLGGGGPVGIGWESGLLAGLAGAGIRLADADLIVGTSAGSVVGAALGLGLEPTEALGAVAGDAEQPDEVDPAALAAFMATLGEAATSGAPPEEARAKIGRLALAAPTPSEDRFVELFALLSGREWPATFSCTAVDAESGALAHWTAESGVALQRAVASSCAVPGIFPPIGINGRRYVDGGVKTGLNADLAAGHDKVLAVSCFALALPPGTDDPMLAALAAQLDAELETVRRTGSLEVIEPNAEFLDLSGWGLNLMDFSRAEAAYDVGVRQAADEAVRVGALWG